jgi:hypothetical protein
LAERLGRFLIFVVKQCDIVRVRAQKLGTDPLIPSPRTRRHRAVAHRALCAVPFESLTIGFDKLPPSSQLVHTATLCFTAQRASVSSSMTKIVIDISPFLSRRPSQEAGVVREEV